MGLFNKILGEAMVYAESFGMTKKYTYEQALEVLLNPKASAIELAKAENTMAMANKETGSEAKRTIGVALCKTHGLLTNAKDRQAQMYEASDFLSAACVEASAEDDHSSFDVLKMVMESDYAKSINLGECALEYILKVKEFEGTEYIFLACAQMYGWGCPVNTDLARDFLEKDAIPGLKDEYHKGIYRLLAELN
ncbi:MAG: hypothetical protein IJD22_01350 [Clostridia bacterium]|nr:hypothetical protein [Clostridia bacterium]